MRDGGGVAPPPPENVLQGFRVNREEYLVPCRWRERPCNLRRQQVAPQARWSSSATRSGANTLRRTQRPPEFCGGLEEHCLRGPPAACGSRPAGACVAFFARATGKRRHPQSFGDGETRRAHAIPNVQELVIARNQLDDLNGGLYVFTYMDCHWSGCWLGSRKSFSG